jgi:hypothetical protein
MGIALGVLAEYEGKVYGINGCAWHEPNGDGVVYKPTGETALVDGIETALQAPVLDDDGNPYWHANLRCPFELEVKALDYTGDSDVSKVMGDKAKHFVTG